MAFLDLKLGYTTKKPFSHSTREIEEAYGACRAGGARTKSDARGSSDARTEWIANLSTISPPRSYLAPVLAKGQPKFRLLGGRELWSGPFQNALLHSLLGAILN